MTRWISLVGDPIPGDIIRRRTDVWKEKSRKPKKIGHSLLQRVSRPLLQAGSTLSSNRAKPRGIKTGGGECRQNWWWGMPPELVADDLLAVRRDKLQPARSKFAKPRR